MSRVRIISLALAASLAWVPDVSADPLSDAMTAYEAGAPQEAVTLLRRAATEGDAVAAVNLGVLIAAGEGTPQDDGSALYWLWKARLSGEARADAMARQVAERMTPEDRDLVLDRLAADLEAEARAGETAALLALGGLEASLRDPSRPEEAYVWFGLSAAFGDVTAPLARDHVAQALSLEDRAAAQAELKDRFESWGAAPSEAGDPSAQPNG